MKKLFKIMIALVLMLTFTFTITACNDEGKDVDPATLTVADVFQEVEIQDILGDKTEKTSYSQLSSKTYTADNGDLRFKCYASYKFEISKIVVKSQEFANDYTPSSYFLITIFDKKNRKTDPITEKKEYYSSEANYNKEQTNEFNFTANELIIEKGDYVCIDISGDPKVKISIQILGKAIID